MQLTLLRSHCKFDYDAKNPTKSNFQFTIDAASLDTKSAKRDGGIYFRAGTMEWSTVAWTTLWGIVIASCWLVAWERGDDANWVDGGLWLIVIAALTTALAMSGSVVYGAAAGLLWVSMLFGWLGSGKLTTFACVPAVTLVGLGIAYAELGFILGAMLTMSMFVLSSKRLSTSRSMRIVFMLVAMGLSTAGVGLVASKFLNDTSSTDSGYGAYK